MQTHSLLFTGTFLAASFSPLFSAVNITEDGVFAEGVTLESGWFDVNKAWNPAFFQNLESVESDGEVAYRNVADEANTALLFPTRDENLCWAASASCILEYMNVQAGNETVYSSTYFMDEDTVKTKLGVETLNWEVTQKRLQTVNQYKSYEVFASNFKDEGYTQEDGIAWYVTGTQARNYGGDDAGIPLKDDAPNKEGRIYKGPGAYDGSAEDTGAAMEYFQENILEDLYDLGNDDEEIKNPESLEELSELLKEGLEIGPIALGVAKDEDPESTGHAITCWGYTTDEDGNVVSIYITDSDDATVYLRELTVDVSVGEDLVKFMLSETSGTEVDLYDIDGTLIGSSETSLNGYRIESMCAFKNFMVVPEPSAFGLLAGIGVLALGVARRCRK